jgi:hypothetical protein
LFKITSDSTMRPVPHPRRPFNQGSLLLSCLLLLVSSTALAAPTAEVIALRGSGEVTTGATTQPLKIGLALTQGATIKTGNPGRAKLRFPDGSVVVISDESYLVLEIMTEAPAADGGSSAFISETFTKTRSRLKRVQLMLESGLIGQEVTADGDRPWSVRSRSAVTAVRGTEFEVEVTADQTTDVHISSGTITVTPAAQAGQAQVAQAQPSFVLDRPGLGISCGLNKGCDEPKAWGKERMRKMFDRLSGV